MRTSIISALRRASLLAWALTCTGQSSLDAWRAHNKFDNRFEGVVPDLVSGERIELFSFVSRPIDFKTPPQLHVRYYQPSKKSVIIVARALAVQYRMESFPKPGEGLLSFDWPTHYQIDKLHIRPSDLGLVGYATKDGKVPPPGIPQIVPLELTSQPGATSAKASGRYLVSFLPNFRVATLKWSLVNSSNMVKDSGKGSGFVEDEPFQIEIPEPPASSSASDYRLTLSAVPLSSGTTTSFSVDFTEPPAGQNLP